MQKLVNLFKKSGSQPSALPKPPQNSQDHGNERTPSPYRRASTKGLSLVVKPALLGEIPKIDDLCDSVVFTLKQSACWYANRGTGFTCSISRGAC